MLHEQLACCEAHTNDHMHPIVREIHTAQIVDDLCHQMEYPFNLPVKDGNPLVWWKSFSDHVHACVLSVHIMAYNSLYMH